MSPSTRLETISALPLVAIGVADQVADQQRLIHHEPCMRFPPARLQRDNEARQSLAGPLDSAGGCGYHAARRLGQQEILSARPPVSEIVTGDH